MGRIWAAAPLRLRGVADARGGKARSPVARTSARARLPQRVARRETRRDGGVARQRHARSARGARRHRRERVNPAQSPLARPEVGA